MNFRIFFFALMILGSINSDAAIYSHITSSAKSGDITTYDFVIDQWTNDSSPNPCYGVGCYISVSHLHNNNGDAGYSMGTVTSSAVPCIKEAATMNDLRSCVMGKVLRRPRGSENPGSLNKSVLSLPLTGRANHMGEIATSECVGLFYNMGKIFSDAASGGTLLPGSVCGVAPNPVYSCSLPTVINLDHSTVSAGEVNGSTTSQKINVNCTGDLSLSIFLQGLENNKIRLGSSEIFSTISLDGDPITESGLKKKFKTGDNNYTIKSTLSTNTLPSAGSYKWQGVMLLAID